MIMKSTFFITIILAIVTATGVYAFAQDGVVSKPALSADMINMNGQPAGKATVTEVAKGVIIRVEATGMSPGWHGVHVHSVGLCDADKDFEDAGPHAGHEGNIHGFMNVNADHTGDLPNLWVHPDGTGQAEFFTTMLSVQTIQDNDGSAILIHAEPDDYSSQPAGNSGDRVACGVISPKT